MANEIFTIRPYWIGSQLVFDDPRVGLIGEAFVGGADTILASLAGASVGESFTVTFSGLEFPGYTHSVSKVRPGGGGTWYVLDGTDLEGWLCPALLRYFATPPQRFFLQVRKP